MKTLIESPINYMGSKYKLLDRLIPLFPKNKTRFYDLFTGGGSVYMNVAKYYKKVIANDSLELVVDIHKNLNNNEYLKIAIDLSKPTKGSQENYIQLRNSYNESPSGSLLLALIWSCNSNMMRFNKKLEFNQTWGDRCFNERTQKKLELYIQQDYSNVKFKNKMYLDVKIKKDSFVYLDPPYHNTEAGYNTLWGDKDEMGLIDYLANLIKDNIPFGISGVINDKENKVFDYLRTQQLNFFYFDDLYKKVSKKEKSNIEYYITNVQDLK